MKKSKKAGGQWGVVVITMIAVALAPVSADVSGRQAADPEGPSKQAAQELFDQALGHFYECRYAEAAEGCRLVIERCPSQQHEARLVLAEIYRAQGRFEEAIDEAVKARRPPADARQMARAQATVRRLRSERRRLERRVAALKRRVSISQDRDEAVEAECKLGHLLLMAGRTEEAAAQYWSVLTKYPDSAEGVVQAARRLRLIYAQQARQEPVGVLYERPPGVDLEPGMAYSGQELSGLMESCRKTIASGGDYECDAGLTLSEIYFLRGRFDKARHEAIQVLEKAARRPIRLYCVSDATDAIERIVRSQERFNRAVAGYKETISSAASVADVLDAEVRLGGVLFVAGRTEQALDHYQAVVSKYADRPEAVKPCIDFLQSRWLRQGGPEGAISKLRTIMVGHPATEAYAYAGCKVAGIYESEGETGRAVARYEDVAAEAPEAVLVRGAVERLKSLYASRYAPGTTIQKLQQIVASRPGTEAAACAAYGIGELHEAEREDNSAIARYESVLSISPDSAKAPEALQRVLAIHRRNKQYDAAIKAAMRLIEQYPESDPAYFAVRRLGDIYAETGELDEAMETFRAIIERHPRSRLAPGCLERLCHLYARGGRLGKTVPFLESIMEQYPEVNWPGSSPAEVFYNVGERLGVEGDLDSAIKCWEEALSVEPDAGVRGNTMFRIAINYAALQQYEKARGAAGRILQRTGPQFGEERLVAQEFIGGMYWQEGRIDEAIAAYEKALELARNESKPKTEARIERYIERLRREK